MLCFYVIRILGLEEIVTTKAQTIISGEDPKSGLSTLGLRFQDFRLNWFLIYLKSKIF